MCMQVVDQSMLTIACYPLYQKQYQSVSEGRPQELQLYYNWVAQLLRGAGDAYVGDT